MPKFRPGNWISWAAASAVAAWLVGCQSPTPTSAPAPSPPGGAPTTPSPNPPTPTPGPATATNPIAPIADPAQLRVQAAIRALQSRWATEQPDLQVAIRFRSLRAGALVVLLSQRPPDAAELARKGATIGTDALQATAPLSPAEVKAKIESELRAIADVRDVLIVEK